MKHKIINIKLSIIGIFLICSISGCKKFIEVDPPVTSLTSGSVYQNDNTAIAVLTGMYENLIADPAGDRSIGAMSLLPELSADNLSLYYLSSPQYLPYYHNDLKATISSSNPLFWFQCYPQIYIANAAIEGLTNSTSLTPSIKTQLLGEARFMRAFYFFYLVNLYGDVPLTLSTDYKTNALMGRTPASDVYKQIIADLEEAQNLLNENYPDITMQSTTSERIRVNKAAATALLARVFLYTGDWTNAELQATKVIENNAYALTSLDSVFLKNSKETIWSLQPTQINVNTWEGSVFILPETGPSGIFPVYLSNQLIDSFEINDHRLSEWVGHVTADGITYYYPAKYKVRSAAAVTEYEIILRLAEQYLIRAEARAQQDKLTGVNSAASDLDAIRERAGLLPTTATTKPQILNAIMHERQVELFTEWGHRWLDLKRTGRIDAVMTKICPLKGTTWAPYKALYPILQSQIEANPGMKGQQNPGYTD